MIGSENGFDSQFQVASACNLVGATSQQYSLRDLDALQDKNDPSKKSECETMFKAISEAYDCLRDPESRAQYDKYGRDGVREGGGAHGHHFSFAEADEMFRQFATMFGSDGSFASMFADAGSAASSMPAGHASSSFSRTGVGAGHTIGSMFADIDRMMGGMGGGFGGGFGQGGAGMTSFSMSSSSSSSLGSGSGGSRVVGRSSHMETVVRGGKRVTRTVTTLRYADGRTETTTDEREDDASSGDPYLLAGDGFGTDMFGVSDAGGRGGRRGGSSAAGGRIGYF